MKQLLLLTASLLPYFIYGQDTSSTKGKRFSIGVNFSSDYCYRTLTKKEKDLSIEQWTSIKNIEDSIYIPKLGYTAGVNLDCQINERLSFQTGIQYSNKGYKTIPILTMYNWVLPPAIAINLTSYYYFDIPLQFTFLSHTKRKIQVIKSVGVVLNYFRKITTKTIPEANHSTYEMLTYASTFDYDKINISPTISLGLKYNLNDRIYLRAEPTFRFSLFSTHYNDYASIHLWSAGLIFSIYSDL